VLSVLLRYTDSDYPFGIFKLFVRVTNKYTDLTFHVAVLFYQNVTICDSDIGCVLIVFDNSCLYLMEMYLLIVLTG